MRIQAQNCGPLKAGSIIIGAGYDQTLYALSDEHELLSFHGDNELQLCRLKDPGCLTFQFVQPLPEGFLAVAGSTGHLVDFDGNLTGEISLGQYIQDVQTTSDGGIWVSYFDQAFGRNVHLDGNYSQLRVFDKSGLCTYRYEALSGTKEIFDCYALNVTSDEEAWCCYNPEFPLVKIKAQRAVAVWRPEIRGVTSFAIWRDTAMMQCGYDANGWRIIRLGESGRVEPLDHVEIVSEDGEPLESKKAIARGPLIWNVHRNHIYRTSLRELAF